MVGRRRFLLLGIGGGAAALIGGTAAQASADSPTVAPVWRLSANWGYAVPPKNRTRCSCQACHSHAANKVFTTKAVALAGRIHPCCVCQPYSIDVLAADAVAIFAGGDTIDLRDDDARARFEAAMVRSLPPVPGPVADPVVPPAPSTPPTPSTPAAVPPVLVPAARDTPAPITPAPIEPNTPSTAAAARPVTLPVTGANHTTLLAAATVLVVAGVAAVATTTTTTTTSWTEPVDR
jgi:hypothetical protein